MSILMDATRITGSHVLEHKYNFSGIHLKFSLNSHNVPVETSVKMLDIGILQRGKA